MSGFFHSASCPPGPLLLSRVIECPSFSWLNISALYVHITLPGTWGRKQPTGGSLVRRCKGVLAADPHLAISHGGQPWPATEKTAGNQRQAQPALHLSSLSTTPHTRESQGRGRAAPVPLWMFLPSLPLQKKKTRVKKVNVEKEVETPQVNYVVKKNNNALLYVIIILLGIVLIT